MPCHQSVAEPLAGTMTAVTSSAPVARAHAPVACSRRARAAAPALACNVPRARSMTVGRRMACAASLKVGAAAAAPPKPAASGAMKTSLGMTFTSYLLKSEMAGQIDSEMVVVLSSIATACKQISSFVQRAGIAGMTGLAGAANVQGEDQKKLDVLSNDVFCAALKESGRTAIIASEEEDVPVAVEETYSGQYIVVFDPLDGSSNIDAAVSTGSIFGIYEPSTTCIAPGSADEATVQVRAATGGRAAPVVVGRESEVPEPQVHTPPAVSHLALLRGSPGELRCERLPARQQPAVRGVLHVQQQRHPRDLHRQGGASRLTRSQSTLCMEPRNA